MGSFSMIVEKAITKGLLLNSTADVDALMNCIICKSPIATPAFRSPKAVSMATSLAFSVRSLRACPSGQGRKIAAQHEPHPAHKQGESLQKGPAHYLIRAEQEYCKEQKAVACCLLFQRTLTATLVNSGITTSTSRSLLDLQIASMMAWL